MAWDVEKWQAQAKNDFNRKYQFECEILFPSAIVNGTLEIVNMMAESTKLPGKKIEMVDVPYAGLPYQVAGAVSYSPWSVTFRLDSNLDGYKRFKAWQELIIGTESNLAALPQQYKSNPNMYLMDGNANRIAQIMLVGAWVTNIGDIDYAQGDRTLATVVIDFGYDYSKWITL